MQSINTGLPRPAPRDTEGAEQLTAAAVRAAAAPSSVGAVELLQDVRM